MTLVASYPLTPWVQWDTHLTQKWRLTTPFSPGGTRRLGLPPLDNQTWKNHHPWRMMVFLFTSLFWSMVWFPIVQQRELDREPSIVEIECSSMHTMAEWQRFELWLDFHPLLVFETSPLNPLGITPQIIIIQFL